MPNDPKIEQIRYRASKLERQAERILDGNAENYDSTDGAAYVSELCADIDYLLSIIASVHN